MLGTGEVPQILERSATATRDSATRGSHATANSRASGQPCSIRSSPIDERQSPAATLDVITRSRTRVAGPPSAPTVPTYLYDADTPRLLTTPSHFAYVKIAEGCDYTCAFCIIPTLRGEYRSRTPTRSCARRARLPARGVRELLLISQDTTFYGIDRGERGALARLLRELNAIDGLEWIRLLYLYPTTITDDVLDAMAECEKVCRYVDLPLQHASAGVLKRMRRPGQPPDLRRAAGADPRPRPGRHAPYDADRRLPRRDGRGVRRARGLRRRHAVRSRRCLHLLPRGRHAGVRASRRRPGGVEAAAPERADGAAEANRRRGAARRGSEREVDVLVDGPSPEHELVLQGRLEGQAPDIDPVVFLTDCDPGAHRPRPAHPRTDRRRARLRSGGRADALLKQHATVVRDLGRDRSSAGYSPAYAIFMGGRFE